jgi:hypothetical protein
VGDDSSISFNNFDVDGCNISEVILFLQKLALSPNASSLNIAFTNHICGNPNFDLLTNLR